MGLYDTVLVKCPNCGEEQEFQSKSGDCLLDVYALEDCPANIFVNINRHAPYKCQCGVSLKVDVSTKEIIIVK